MSGLQSSIDFVLRKETREKLLREVIRAIRFELKELKS